VGEAVLCFSLPSSVLSAVVYVWLCMVGLLRWGWWL